MILVKMVSGRGGLVVVLLVGGVIGGGLGRSQDRLGRAADSFGETYAGRWKRHVAGSSGSTGFRTE
jgi:hypothetical protein